jgi:DNA phosphorothioation-associated putative methyltransferase
MSKAASTVGKRVGRALYVHRDAIPEISAREQRAIRKALAICRASDWNVARIDPEKVAFLEYEDFDVEHFPALRRSLLVDLQSRESKRRDFSSSENPPILHRKELLLPSADPRRGHFAALTAELEARALFAESHKIGLRRSWQQRLDAAGIVLRDHRIVQKDEGRDTSVRGARSVRVERHRTAIARNRLSSPMQMLARHGFIDSCRDLFDYGCGHGDDVRVLVEAGISAAGWDPHFRPNEEKRPADLVNLGFVINVIEDPKERLHALQEAWTLCRKVMTVAVMVEGHYPVDGLTPFGDGFLTSRGTFQRFYSPHELRALVREALDTEPVAVAPGIVFVFRDAVAEQEFLFRRRTRHVLSDIRFAASPRPRLRRPAEPLSERLSPVLGQLWTKAVELGREPEVDEVPEIRETLARSKVSISRAMAWCRAKFDEAQLEVGARRRKADLLVHFALGAFSGSRAFNTLPPTLRRDVRHFFGSFGSVQAEAQHLLFSLGSEGALEGACVSAAADSRVHNHAEGMYHFGARQLEELPAVLRIFVGCAAVLVGDGEDANVVAINVPKRSAAFYFSPDFGAPLTLFNRVTTVYLRDQHVRDQKLSDDARLLFLHGSSYETDVTKRRRRSVLEARVRSILLRPSTDMLTVRYADVASALRRTAPGA